MKELGPPDSFHLSSALGWIELGNLPEARLELEKIAEALRKHLDVLEVLWMFHAAQQDWPAALQAAREMVETAPDHPGGFLNQAYATRRVPGGTVEAAYEVLRPAADKFPTQTLISYNLACYACQMGRVEEARARLKQAFSAGAKKAIQAMALHDDDLRPLWQEIETM